MKRLLTCFIIVVTLCSPESRAISLDQEGVETVNGQQVIRHKVSAGDTWYSIARKYEIPYAQLRLANKGAAESLSIGQMVNVPSKAKPTDPSNLKNTMDQPKPAATKPVSVPAKPAPVAEPAKTVSGETKHKVAPGETVYRISKMYNVKPADLCAWNNIKNNSLELGQILIIKGASVAATSPAPAANPVPPSPVAPAVAPAKEQPKVEVTEAEPVTAKPVPSDFSFAKNRKEIQESGDADRIYDEPVNPNKYYALHATAPIGTIIMVRNLSNDRSVFVKVVGRLEETESNRGLVIKLSRSSADQIKAPGKRFKVELLYGMGVPKVR
jgi:LysM repeat protein